jgi:ribosomal-protein-serine acetyltransferase
MERNAAAAADDLNISIDGNTVLRVVMPEDAEELYAVIDRNREYLYKWLAWAHPGYSIEDTRIFLDDCIAQFARRESLTMTIRYQGQVCGVIGLHRIDPRNLATSIGYWIDEGHQGKGIVTAACRAVIAEGFRSFGLHRIEIRCATWNHRSSAIPRRLEFAEEGILREAEHLGDKWLDLRVFSMLTQDWLK